jgi:hypothetical protein
MPCFHLDLPVGSPVSSIESLVFQPGFEISILYIVSVWVLALTLGSTIDP